jgi:hypothetical protein
VTTTNHSLRLYPCQVLPRSGAIPPSSRQGYSDLGSALLLAKHGGLRNGPGTTPLHLRRHKATAGQVRPCPATASSGGPL